MPDRGRLADRVLNKEKNHERGRSGAKQNSREQLPLSYGGDRVVLLPVEPYLAHIYWDLSPGKERLPSQKAQPVLRFHDITGKGADAPSGCFDVEVDLRSGNWYVPLWSPGRSYVVELGYRNGGGRFYPLIRSNEADFPPSRPSEETAEEFMLVMGDADRGVLLLREFEETSEIAEEPAGVPAAQSESVAVDTNAINMEEAVLAGISAAKKALEPIPPAPPVFFSAEVGLYMQEREEEQRMETLEKEQPLQEEMAKEKEASLWQEREGDLTARAERSFGLTARSVPSGYERK